MKYSSPPHFLTLGACIILIGLSVTYFFGVLRVPGQNGRWPADSPLSAAAGTELSSGEDPQAGAGSEETTAHRSIKYAGKFHLMAIHFPIALLVAAMMAQWCAIAKDRGGSLVGPLLAGGAIAAVCAAGLGWMYAYDSVYFGDDEKILFWHRWLGTGTAALATAVALIKKRLGPKSLAAALTACAILVAAAAHFGGSLVYGTDFFKKF